MLPPLRIILIIIQSMLVRIFFPLKLEFVNRINSIDPESPIFIYNRNFIVIINFSLAVSHNNLLNLEEFVTQLVSVHENI